VSHSETQTTGSESQEPATGHDNWSWFMWAGLAFLIAYPLSIGPVAKLYSSTGSAPEAVRAFYAPLGLVYHQSETARKAFDWYAELWGTHL